MELREIIEMNKEFQKNHGWAWNFEDERKMLDVLKYSAIALSGEAGEFANMLKKSVRENFPEGRMPDAEKIQKMKDEIVDIFIYTILASIALDMDLEAEFLKKIKLNEQRFKNFENKKSV